MCDSQSLEKVDLSDFQIFKGSLFADVVIKKSVFLLNETIEAQSNIKHCQLSYSISCLASLTPVEAINDNIASQDYETAKAIATKYLDSQDSVYIAQWQNADISETCIKEYLHKIQER